jgi:hypothetical protein
LPLGFCEGARLRVHTLRPVNAASINLKRDRLLGVARHEK